MDNNRTADEASLDDEIESQQKDDSRFNYAEQNSSEVVQSSSELGEATSDESGSLVGNQVTITFGDSQMISLITYASNSFEVEEVTSSIFKKPATSGYAKPSRSKMEQRTFFRKKPRSTYLKKNGRKVMKSLYKKLHQRGRNNCERVFLIKFQKETSKEEDVLGSPSNE